MAFKGKANKGSGNQWYGGNTSNDGSVVYGKLNGSWLHAKEVKAKKNGEWTRAWLDCREHDAGGSGWEPETLAAVYSGTCGYQTYQVPVRYTKPGCPTYTRNGTTVASPTCFDGASHLGDNDCYDASTGSAVYFDGSCGTRRLRTATTTVPKPTSGCGSTTYYGAPYTSANCDPYDTNCYNAPTGAYVYRYSCASRERAITYTFTSKSTCGDYSYTTAYEAYPDCEGACRTAKTGNFSQGGVGYYYLGTPGEYVSFPHPYCPAGCDESSAYFTVTTCGGTNYFTFQNIDYCRNPFGEICYGGTWPNQP